MPSKRIVLNQTWTQISADSTSKLVECVSGTGVAVEADAAPPETQTWGHPLRGGDPIRVTESVYARASENSPQCVLIIT
ncbi:TPA: hypothetical protein QCI16_003083 [Enterobacter ludwigii]|uniref:hypothetical protein n=1 Tax=Enterobacter sp. 200527-13 TaxID=2995131 RepID=UPI0022C3BBF9|nr:hypothetical protein [Enterobacter sp. 200527-13]GLH24118.1 hypothetical protein ENT52713_15140 [Enterobacter sp. 200527-13]HDR2588937.1 hypothetical protein [Enterobacter ludwigii]HDR2598905.1 hypothetical protein [Enterobacter ludwigii]